MRTKQQPQRSTSNKKNQKGVSTIQLFNSLKQKDAEGMDHEDIAGLFEKLDIQLADPFGGYLFYLMKNTNNSFISKESFQNLINYLHVDNIKDLKAKIPGLRKQFQSPDVFKQVYNFLFDLYKETEQIKIIPFELASQLWNLYLEKRYKLSDKFLQYIEKAAEKKNVTRDTWTLANQFISVTDENFSNYNEMEGWPVFIDSFVAFAKGT